MTVKKRGIETFSKSSVLRVRPDHTDLLEDLNEISVQRGWQRTYTHSGMIAAYINRCSVLEKDVGLQRDQKDRFSTKNHCFMCDEKITAEFWAAQTKLPFPKRNNMITKGGAFIDGNSLESS